jgi:hypothetical protein
VDEHDIHLIAARDDDESVTGIRPDDSVALHLEPHAVVDRREGASRLAEPFLAAPSFAGDQSGAVAGLVEVVDFDEVDELPRSRWACLTVACARLGRPAAAGPHDHSHPPAASRLATASATLRSSRSSSARAAARYRIRPVASVGVPRYARLLSSRAGAAPDDCKGDDAGVRSRSPTTGADLRFARPAGDVATFEING